MLLEVVFCVHVYSPKIVLGSILIGDAIWSDSLIVEGIGDFADKWWVILITKDTEHNASIRDDKSFHRTQKQLQIWDYEL